MHRSINNKEIRQSASTGAPLPFRRAIGLALRRRSWAPYAAPVVLFASLVVQGPAVRADSVLTRLEVPVTIRARQQPVDEFLREMLGEVGLPVQVDAAVSGPVNGDFDKPMSDVLEDVRRAFNLVYYYDGAVLHAYPAGAVERRILYEPASIAGKVVEHVQVLLLPDASNRIEQVSMGLVVSGTPRFLEQVQEILDSVSGQAAAAPVAETYRIFNLKYGWADDVTLFLGGERVVVPGVASLLIDLVGQGVGAGSDAGAPTATVRRTPVSPTVPKLKGQGLQTAGLEAEGVQAADPVAASVTTRSSSGSGRVRIVADPLHNAVVIRDRADRMGTYERLIRQLDVEPLMVEIEATIIDIDVDRLRQLGIDWRLDYGVTNTVVEGSIGGSPLGDGDIVSMVLGDRLRFLSRIRALERQDAARIVSKPHVITLANVEAVLDSTSTFYVRIAGREEVDLFPVSVGTTLRVVPHVLQDGAGTRIKLLVGIEDGGLSTERVDEIPVVNNSTINTQALVDEGQSLLIGGLVRDSDRNIASKVPILGDLPGVGALFRGNRKSSRRTERLFLISPRLTVDTRAGGGYRLDAPILSGTEADIVSSSPTRLRGTRATLAERDTRFPTVPTLPSSTTSADLARTDPAEDEGDTGPGPAFRNDPIRLQADVLQDDVTVSRAEDRERDAELARTITGMAGKHSVRFDGVPSPARPQGPRTSSAERDAQLPIVPAWPRSTADADLAGTDPAGYEGGTGPVPVFRNDPIRLQEDFGTSRVADRVRDAQPARVPLQLWSVDPVPVRPDPAADSTGGAGAQPLRIDNAPIRLR